jgi:hypothetical protein
MYGRVVHSPFLSLPHSSHQLACHEADMHYYVEPAAVEKLPEDAASPLEFVEALEAGRSGSILSPSVVVDSFLSSGDQVLVVLGEAGSGKSSLLYLQGRRLLQQLQQQQQQGVGGGGGGGGGVSRPCVVYPVLIELKAFRSEELVGLLPRLLKINPGYELTEQAVRTLQSQVSLSAHSQCTYLHGFASSFMSECMVCFWGVVLQGGVLCGTQITRYASPSSLYPSQVVVPCPAHHLPPPPTPMPHACTSRTHDHLPQAPGSVTARLVVMCDGLDELQGGVDSVRDFLSTLCGGPGQAWPPHVLTLIVTSREDRLGGLGEENAVFGDAHRRLVLLPFDETRVRGTWVWVWVWVVCVLGWRWDVAAQCRLWRRSGVEVVNSTIVVGGVLVVGGGAWGRLFIIWDRPTGLLWGDGGGGRRLAVERLQTRTQTQKQTQTAGNGQCDHPVIVCFSSSSSS